MAVEEEQLGAARNEKERREKEPNKMALVSAVASPTANLRVIGGISIIPGKRRRTWDVGPDWGPGQSIGEYVYVLQVMSTPSRVVFHIRPPPQSNTE